MAQRNRAAMLRGKILRAFEDNDVDAIQQLLSDVKGMQAAADAWDEDGWHVLHWAVYHCSVDACTALLSRGLSPELATRDKHCHTALLLAARLGYTSLCKVLLKAGASVTEVDADGCGALELAKEAGHHLTAHYLATQTIQPVDPTIQQRHCIPAIDERPVPNRRSMQTMSRGRIVFSFVCPSLPLLPLCIGHGHWAALLPTALLCVLLLRETFKARIHFFSCWWGSVALVYSVWLGVMVPHDWPLSQISLRKHLFLLFATAELFLFVYYIKKDPGCLPLYEDFAMLVEAAEDGRDVEGYFCFTCMARRPYRSKHSWAEGRCIARFDHHCGWLNQTIGAGNHVAFLLFGIQHGFLILLINMAIEQCLFGQERWTTGHWCLAYVYFFNGVTGLFLCYVVWTTLYNAGCNATVNERTNCTHPPYTDYCGNTPEGFVTKFDYGFWYNLFDFFTPLRRQLWFSAYRLEDITPVTGSLIGEYFLEFLPRSKKRL